MFRNKNCITITFIKLTDLLIKGEAKECERVNVDKQPWLGEDGRDTWLGNQLCSGQKSEMNAFRGVTFSSI